MVIPLYHTRLVRNQIASHAGLVGSKCQLDADVRRAKVESPGRGRLVKGRPGCKQGRLGNGIGMVQHFHVRRGYQFCREYVLNSATSYAESHQKTYHNILSD
jgi:hypothetical protein